MRRYARLGADRDLIVRALGIPTDLLRDPAFLAQLAGEIDRGHALGNIDLLQDVKRLRTGGPGKVNAVLASLRQRLGWNRQDSGATEKERPDAEVAVAELQKLLRRFGAPR